MSESETVPGVTEGAFITSLKRNYKQIREDRAASICEDTQLIFKRRVEDLELELKKLQRERDALIDISPATTHTLSVATDFNANDFVNKDIALGIKIRNTEITYSIAKERYVSLFGGM